MSEIVIKYNWMRAIILSIIPIIFVAIIFKNQSDIIGWLIFLIISLIIYVDAKKVVLSSNVLICQNYFFYVPYFYLFNKKFEKSEITIEFTHMPRAGWKMALNAKKNKFNLFKRAIIRCYYSTEIPEPENNLLHLITQLKIAGFEIKLSGTKANVDFVQIKLKNSARE